MKKAEFLTVLRNELEKNKVNDIDSIIEYYDELIEDKIEQDKKKDEVGVVAALGSVSEIVRNVILDQRLETATEKPTILNGFKAMTAFLGVLSLPVLIILAIVIGSLLLAGITLLGSFLVVVASMAVTFILAVFVLCVWLAQGQIALPTFFMGLGISLTLIGISLLLMKALGKVIQQLVLWTVDKIKTQTENKGKEADYE